MCNGTYSGNDLILLYTKQPHLLKKNILIVEPINTALDKLVCKGTSSGIELILLDSRQQHLLKENILNLEQKHTELKTL